MQPWLSGLVEEEACSSLHSSGCFSWIPSCLLCASEDEQIEVRKPENAELSHQVLTSLNRPSFFSLPLLLHSHPISTSDRVSRIPTGLRLSREQRMILNLSLYLLDCCGYRQVPPSIPGFMKRYASNPVLHTT